MNLFVLTPEEKRIVAFVMLMILLGVGVKKYRTRHPPAPISAEVRKHPWMRKLPPLPLATPGSAQAASDSTARPRSRKPRKKKPAPQEEPTPSDVPAGAEGEPPY